MMQYKRILLGIIYYQTLQHENYLTKNETALIQNDLDY